MAERDGGGGVEALLALARARIERVDPPAAWHAASHGDVVLVDIRCDDDRRRTAVVPGSFHIPRTVLEWRLDPSGAWRNPHVPPDRSLLLICSDGFSSSLAAASLVDLGLPRSGDVIGGFTAWQRAGLPVRDAAAARPGPAGMGGPD